VHIEKKKEMKKECFVLYHVFLTNLFAEERQSFHKTRYSTVISGTVLIAQA
jgi:hypothetical protein